VVLKGKIYIKSILRVRDQNEYRKFLHFFLKDVVVMGLCTSAKPDQTMQQRWMLQWTWILSQNTLKIHGKICSGSTGVNPIQVQTKMGWIIICESS